MKNDYKIVTKAYKINLDKLDEGYLSDSIICHSKNLNKAKIKLLEKVKYDDWKLKYTNDILTYLNIPVKRCKESDLVIFEGEEVLRNSIQNKITNRQKLIKLDEISNNKNIKYCYIFKNGWYYKSNYRGYTSSKFEAGVYPKDDAIMEAKSVQEIILECINIEEHNKMINEKITELKNKLII